MTTNAFTAPRKPFWTDAERSKLRQSEGGRRGGQTRHKEDGSNVYTTGRVTPSTADEPRRSAASDSI